MDSTGSFPAHPAQLAYSVRRIFLPSFMANQFSCWCGGYKASRIPGVPMFCGTVVAKCPRRALGLRNAEAPPHD